MADGSAVLYEKKDSIGIITLNRPERMNAISVEVWNALDDIWTTVDNDDEVRVLVITGAGEKAFCAGMDLKQQAELSAMGKDIIKEVKDPYMKNMRKVKKPIIAAVNGIAAAGGFLIAENSDLRVASKNATFSIREAKVGRGSPWAVPLLWMMPLGITLELTMTGEPLTADRAYQVGFVNKLAEPGDTLNQSLKMAEIIRDNAPLSVIASKLSLYEAMSLGCEKGMARADEIYEMVYKSEDAIEGPKAFAEKRKPQWKGR
jgi:enoyl-CoA hydratase